MYTMYDFDKIKKNKKKCFGKNKLPKTIETNDINNIYKYFNKCCENNTSNIAHSIFDTKNFTSINNSFSADIPNISEKTSFGFNNKILQKENNKSSGGKKGSENVGTNNSSFVMQSIPLPKCKNISLPKCQNISSKLTCTTGKLFLLSGNDVVTQWSFYKVLYKELCSILQTQFDALNLLKKTDALHDDDGGFLVNLEYQIKTLLPNDQESLSNIFEKISDTKYFAINTQWINAYSEKLQNLMQVYLSIQNMICNMIAHENICNTLDSIVKIAAENNIFKIQEIYFDKNTNSFMEDKTFYENKFFSKMLLDAISVIIHGHPNKYTKMFAPMQPFIPKSMQELPGIIDVDAKSLGDYLKTFFDYGTENDQQNDQQNKVKVRLLSCLSVFTGLILVLMLGRVGQVSCSADTVTIDLSGGVLSKSLLTYKKNGCDGVSCIANDYDVTKDFNEAKNSQNQHSFDTENKRVSMFKDIFRKYGQKNDNNSCNNSLQFIANYYCD